MGFLRLLRLSHLAQEVVERRGGFIGIRGAEQRRIRVLIGSGFCAATGLALAQTPPPSPSTSTPDGGQVEIRTIDLRDFTADRHRTVDDRPFGGGEGMVFKPEPLAAAIRSLQTGAPGERVVFLSPQGRLLTQK